MNDPSIDNPRLATPEGEAEHIARERAWAATTARFCTDADGNVTPHDPQQRNEPSCLVVRPQDGAMRARCRRCGEASPCPGGQTVAGGVCELVTQQPPAGAGAANVPDETSNAAVGAAAHMVRAVLAAEHFRQVGVMPAWTTDPERTEQQHGD